MFIKIIVVCAMLFCSPLLHAEDAPISKWQLQLGGFTYHMPHKRYNEENLGLGVEYQILESTALQIGYYRNSVGLRSDYRFIQFHPIDIFTVRLGITGGYVDGYPHHNKGHYGKIIIPSFSKQFKHFGVNGIFMPPLGHDEGVLFVGFKVPFSELQNLIQ